MTNKYAAFFTTLRRHAGLTKEDAVLQFTAGCTHSLKALDNWELQELTRRLQAIAPPPAPPYPGGEKANQLRRVLIAIFKGMGKTVADAAAWAQRQGVRGYKKKFNDYTTGELHQLIEIAKKIEQHWREGIRKRISNIQQ